MTCEVARERIVLLACGELPETEALELEQHTAACIDCAEEAQAHGELQAWLGAYPLAEPDANLLAQSRMRLDDALDAMPRRGLLAALIANGSAWLGHLRSAPALATLLLGAGFLGGNFTYRYQVAHQPRVAPPVILTNTTGGGIASVSGIAQLPNDMVQVSYNRMVPEMAQGSLNDPQIRQLLMLGTRAATDNTVRVSSVALLADECRTGFGCKSAQDDSGIRAALLASLRSDRNPGVRMKALEGLEPYVSDDERVRDAVARTLLSDPSSTVRMRAVTLLEPVQDDSSVRQALRTVSTRDDNPYLRTVSTQALASSSSIQ